MASKTKKGKEIRLYYIKVENLARCMKDYLVQLRDNQLTDVKKDYKLLENTHNNILRRRRRDLYEIGNVVYFVSHPAFDLFYKDHLKISILR